LALPVYRGPFGARQAERLLWRAGFGPKPGQVAAFAKLGMREAVRRLVEPPSERLTGPNPRVDGNPLAPQDAWGHDVLWWLDRMVRTRRPLVERMTLVWHDWFATSNDGVGSQKLMLRQNGLFRANALGNFRTLLFGVTKDPAMILWLSAADNTKWEPNENYARELMELFTLGVNRGYTETDVRQQARALTGFRYDWTDAGPVRFRFDGDWHDTGYKTIFGKRGRFDWEDACRLCVGHWRHRSFFVRKLWSYFIPTPPSATTLTELQRLYARGGYAVKPVVAAILRHPALYTGPRMVKPPGRRRGRDAPRQEPRRGHGRLGLARRHGRPASLPAAERGGLGRFTLARHRDLPRPVAPGELRARGVHQGSRRGQGNRAVRRWVARPTCRRVLGVADFVDADEERPRRLRRAGPRSGGRELEARDLPGARPERAPAADRNLP
jgi:hypothetical protein